MQLIFVVGRFSSEGSGVERAASDLANALAHCGTPVDLYATTCETGAAPRHLVQPPNRCLAAPGRWCGGLSVSPSLKQMLFQAVPQADLVHVHTLWMLPNHYASTAARRAGKPILFTPHGSLEPYALAISRWKKRITGAWFQDRDFRRATCFHVLSPHEVAGLRAYGIRGPIAVVPNGVDLTALHPLPDREVFDRDWPQLAGRRLCLFLSRLHHKKGLRHLVEAWRRLANDYPDWRLVIAGPDYGLQADLCRWIEELRLTHAVALTGPLFGDQKRAALGAASLFVLPSHSEGFSMAILEALACNLPVLITPGCNFPEVARCGAGLEVPPTVEGTENGLRHLLSLSDAERAEYGRRGRQLVEERYTWEHVAHDMLRLYAWLAGGGAAPDFIDYA